MLIRYTKSMEKPANSPRKPRDDDHASDKSASVRTASGETKKGLSALGGGAMGVLNGVFWGAVIAVPAVIFLPFASVGAGVMMCVGLTAAFKGIQGARDGYYDAQSKYKTPERKKHGAREESGVSDESVAKAAKMAEKESPKQTAAEMQELELGTHEEEVAQEQGKEEESYRHRDRVDRSRAQGERTR